MANKIVQKLAAYSTIKGMADSDQFKNQYYMLAEFIRYVIFERNIHSFSIFDMITYLKQEFEDLEKKKPNSFALRQYKKYKLYCHICPLVYIFKFTT